MRIFMVMSSRDPDKLAEKISKSGYENFKIKSDSWFVSADGTTREVAEKLGIRGGETGPGIVCLVESYSGRLPKEAWEWLGLREARSE